jgi:hypothetical protein
LTVGGKIPEKGVEAGRTVEMGEMQIAAIGSLYLNEASEDYNKINDKNIMKYGKTDRRKHILR